MQILISLVFKLLAYLITQQVIWKLDNLFTDN
jgi:hypothetical protein